MYVAAFHFLAGLVAGSTFAIRTLLVLVGLSLVECMGVTIARGISAGFSWLGGLVAVQIGYLGGIYLRSILEHVRVTEPEAGPRRHP